MAGSKIRYTSIERAAEKVAKEMGMPYNIVFDLYYAYCKEIYNKMRSLPLSKETTKEEFDALRPNVNLFNLGKFYMTWESHRHRFNKQKYVQNRKENKTAQHRLVGNDESL